MLAGYETVTRRLGLVTPLPSQPIDTISLASSRTTSSNVVPARIQSPAFANSRTAGSGLSPPRDVWRAAALLLVGNATTPSTISKSGGGGTWSVKFLHVNATEDTVDNPAAVVLGEEVAGPLDVSDVGVPVLVGVSIGTGAGDVPLQFTTARAMSTAVNTRNESTSLPARFRPMRSGSHATPTPRPGLPRSGVKEDDRAPADPSHDGDRSLPHVHMCSMHASALMPRSARSMSPSDAPEGIPCGTPDTPRRRASATLSPSPLEMGRGREKPRT